MGLFDIFKVKQYKEEIERLSQKLNSLDADDYLEVKRRTSELEQSITLKEKISF